MIQSKDYGVIGGTFDPVIIPIQTYSNFPYEIFVYCEGLAGKQGGDRFDFQSVDNGGIPTKLVFEFVNNIVDNKIYTKYLNKLACFMAEFLHFDGELIRG